jgi:hypothetical protein
MRSSRERMDEFLTFEKESALGENAKEVGHTCQRQRQELTGRERR